MRRVVVIGGGLSGLVTAHSILHEAASRAMNVELSLWEAAPRFGGKIGTVHRGGYRCEIGPNGFLDNTPQTLELVERIGLTGRLLPSSDAARRRFIFSGGRLRQLPESPLSFFRSDLMTLPGRMRIVGEYFVPGRKDYGNGEDETVASFIRRRLGKEALEKLIDPMTSGIYAGDPERMSMASCFPRIVALERNYGGLIRGMLARGKEAKKAGEKGPSNAGPGGTLTSFAEGLQELIDTLAGTLGDRARYSSPVLDITPAEDGGAYTVTFEGGHRVDAEAVVLASPAYAAAEICSTLAPEAAGLLREIPYSTLSIVHLGLDKARLGRDLDGFGFLIPHREGRRILGSLWSSSIFPDRAPGDAALVTTMVGGARDPDTPMLPDEDLTGVVREELGATMSQTEPPAFSLVTRWEKAIPQYLPGHEARLQKIEGLLGTHRGLFLTGNAYRGIGVNDCVKAAFSLAPRVADYLDAGSR